ncbi:MAG TPA: UDP-3-O-(3-hydroxymyristoyl)glucosamine N-acyltransferase [Candidatus Sabulitectum sp.]|nr:UDP-3-O-(3-hydroxymyristoyl)glucosamine N-acyltransferase [Candidatus Sabulitectum sp.]HPR23375.1 UDP-3-O-(3-hydroxymyristoyl)glucosamine N-acyltransferase [Candidatus Sabulitectum sp.]
MTDPIAPGSIAELLGGRLVGSPGNALVTGVSTLMEAGPGDICYYGNTKYARYLPTTGALAVLVQSECQTSARCQIIVDDPYDCFRKVLLLFQPDRSSGFPGVHPSAVIHDTAVLKEGVEAGPLAVIHRDCVIGRNCQIGSGCVLGAGTVVGESTVLHPGVTLLAGTVVGNGCIIHSGTVVGSDGFGFVPCGSGQHRKIPQNGNVVIGNNVEIGSNCSIDRAVTGSTMIGDHTKLDNLIQVAHNVRIGSSCLIAAQTGIAGSATIGSGVVIGGQVGIAGHIEIGDGAVIAAKSGVTKSLPPGVTVSGNPCRPHGENLRISAAAARLPGILESIRNAAKGSEEETED